MSMGSHFRVVRVMNQLLQGDAFFNHSLLEFQAAFKRRSVMSHGLARGEAIFDTCIM